MFFNYSLLFLLSSSIFVVFVRCDNLQTGGMATRWVSGDLNLIWSENQFKTWGDYD